MENLSHSFSKRSYGGNGFGTASHKSVYDDVFGGPPKFGMPTLAPRLEDYSEIFGGFHSARGSSIPILDLPVVDEAELCFDIRSSGFDYSEVFGGFNGLDFALSLDDFVRKSNGRDESSDDDAWSPAESESPSGDTDPSAFSDRSQSLINEDTYHPTTGIGQFDASYGEATDVAQLHAIPGNAYMFEKNHISPKVEVQTSQAASDLKSNMGFDGGTSEVKRTIFLPGKFDFRRQERVCSHVEKNRGPGFDRIKPFVTVNDINLRTKPSQLPPPSRPPPVYADKKGASAKLNLRSKDSSSCSLEQVEGNSSLPLYDVEIDGSSSMLASATMRDAMEKAQAKIRSAKESINKKEVLRSCSKLQPQSFMQTVEENVNKTIESFGSCKDDRKVKCAEESGRSVPLAEESNKLFKMDQKVSDLVEPERYIDFAERSMKRRNGKESGLSAQDFAWRQETEYFEVVEAGIPFKAIEQHKDETKFVHKGSVEFRDWVVNEAFEKKEEVTDFKEAKKAPKLDEKKNKVGVAAEACGDGMRSETASESNSQLVFPKIAKLGSKSCESDVNKKKIKMAKQPEEIKRLQNDSVKSGENQTKADMNVLETNHKPRGIRDRTGSNKMLSDSYARKTNERKPKEDLEIEESDERLSEAVEQEEIKRTEIILDERKKQDECHEKQKNEKKHEEGFGSKENGNMPKGVIDLKDNEKRPAEVKEYGKNSEKSFEKNENKRSQELDGSTMTFVEIDIEASSTVTSISTNSTPIEACEHQEFTGCAEEAEQIKRDRRGGTAKLDQVTHLTMESETIKAFDGKDKLTSDSYSVPLSEEHDKGFGKVETTQAAISCEKDEDSKTKLEESEHGINARVTNCLAEERLHSPNQDEFQRAKCETGTTDVMNYLCFDQLENDSIEAGIDIGNSSIKLDKEVSERPFEPDHTKVKAYEQAQRVKKPSGVQLDFSHRISKDNLTSYQPCVDLSENGKVTGASLTGVLGDGEIQLNSGKNCIQNVEWKEKNMNETLSVETNEIEERLQKERESEKEHLRKIEEREREREREKDRMAIDRAMLEAHDRLYVDARERAERARATAEVRQRTLAEAREKLEKSSLEARERSLADKASMEARLRAERAAVERATLEARQRAFEKAMADRVLAEGRERVERSVSDKFFTYSRTDEMRQSSYFSNTGTSNALRYSYSSVHIGNESESPQRCKARLERYRRTAARAAKALEEKNLRDLVAQREQAERNRLAETLDGEVKRWSSGKEGNLRALLSTLQYILGPESGWQPIPLTEVITSAAVKKAYRKATLCVHPDKLQQRGASIQQKYICEKVFDLLKEAWNTFNSEER